MPGRQEGEGGLPSLDRHEEKQVLDLMHVHTRGGERERESILQLVPKGGCNRAYQRESETCKALSLRHSCGSLKIECDLLAALPSTHTWYSRFPWLSMTALGCPEVPEVKTSVARSERDTCSKERGMDRAMRVGAEDVGGMHPAKTSQASAVGRNLVRTFAGLKGPLCCTCCLPSSATSS
jgi:hypothetical protein